MKNINKNELLENLKELKKGEKIFIDVNKDFTNAIKYLDVKFTSLQNLFNSYINTTSEKANEMKLDDFLERYYKVEAEKRILIEKAMRDSFGDAFEYFKTNAFKYTFDLDLNVIMLERGE